MSEYRQDVPYEDRDLVVASSFDELKAELDAHEFRPESFGWFVVANDGLVARVTGFQAAQLYGMSTMVLNVLERVGVSGPQLHAVAATIGAAVSTLSKHEEAPL